LDVYWVVGEDLRVTALDENLDSFWGFHQGKPDCQARVWKKARIGAVEPGQVVGLDVREMASMLHVSMEIEEPILDYSRQNGEGFRFLLPNLARFMGMNREQAAYAEAHGLPWCESPWCAEERRHANTFAKMIERLTKVSVRRENPNQPMAAATDEAGALAMLISREAAEWNSSSTYIVMAAHARGELRTLIRNIARDEIKHLSVLSAAHLYLLGPSAWERLSMLVRKSLKEYSGHRRKRSEGSQMGANPVTALEVIAAHLLSEFRIRRWLRTLPVPRLRWAFEAPSQLATLEAECLPPQQRGEYEATVALGLKKRLELSRWPARAREQALRRS
jgi:hypothetical protein